MPTTVRRRPVPADQPAPPSPAELLAPVRDSFARFAQPATAPHERADEGLQGAFRAVFPARSDDEGAALEFVSYSLERPRFDEAECARRGLTYAAPLKVTIRLVVWDPPDAQRESRMIRDIKEQEIYFGEVPLLTPRGTFRLEGVERTFAARRVLRTGPHLARRADDNAAVATVVGARGQTLVLAAASDGAVEVAVQLAPWSHPAGVLPPAIAPRTLLVSADQGAAWPLADLAPGEAAARVDITAPADPSKVLLRKGAKLTAPALARLKSAGVARVPLSDRDLWALRLADDAPVPESHRGPHAARNARLSPARVAELARAGLERVQVYRAGTPPALPAPARFADAEDAVRWVFERLSPIEVDAAGRAALHAIAGRELEPADYLALTETDVRALIEVLRAVQRGERPLGEPVDPRRVWRAGEALTAHAWRGLVDTTEALRDRMNTLADEIDVMMPHDLLNAKPLTRALRAMFDDATEWPTLDDANPLAALAHALRVRDDADALASPEEVSGTQSAELAALPLASPEAPWVGTGREHAVALAAGAVTVAEHAGRVLRVDDETLLVWPDELDATPPQVVRARPHRGTHRGTACIERVAVEDGARVASGDVLLEASAVAGGELALGRNVWVALLERETDGARVSARAQRAFAAARYRVFECLACDTDLGVEEITRELPGGVAPALDESGVPPQGAHVAPGDVLVGKRAPDGAGGWRDASLRVPAGVRGVVHQVQWLLRAGQERPPRAQAAFDAEDARRAALRAAAAAACAGAPEAQRPDAEAVRHYLDTALCDDESLRARPDPLPRAVRQVVRVTIETDAPLAPGDHLADRNGLLVPVREVVPDDAMPRLDDGTPVDVVLPARGAPPATRTELRLGRAARALDTRLRVPAGCAVDEATLAALEREAGVTPAGAASAGVLYLMRQLPPAG